MASDIQPGEVRIPFGQHGGLRDTDGLVLRTRKGAERTVPSFRWWINRNTPTGEDADLWERMPFGGRRAIQWRDVLAVLRNPERARAIASSTGKVSPHAI